jgi:hypothetical protein
MEPDTGDNVLSRVADDIVLVERQAADDVTPPLFSSLYHSESGTYAAILAGLFIVTMVQLGVVRIFRTTRTMIEALTFFATSMVAFLVAVFLCDLLIAGAEVSLLADGERAAIVGFVKDICLMVFAYFFGSRATTGGTNDADG